MELVLPNNYVEVEEEEMMYLDGGFSGSVFIKNMKGMRSRYSGVSKCFNWGVLAGVARYGYTYAVAKYGVGLVRVATWVFGYWGAIIGLTVASAAVSYLGNYRVFY